MAANIVVEHMVELAQVHHRHAVDPTHGAGSLLRPMDAIMSDTGKPFIIPILGLVIGATMMKVPKPQIADPGKLVLYFGAQSFMNIFMGWVLGTCVTVAAGTKLDNGQTLKEALRGCPAGFALTAMQQIVSFFVFIIYFLVMKIAGTDVKLKVLSTTTEKVSVLIFGCVFALNIALNNFSLGYISIAVNLIIRSCLPLTTFASQQGLASFGYYEWQPNRPLEILLMLIGVLCAGVFTVAQIMGSSDSGDGDSNAFSQILGVVMCIASLLCGSLNLALAGVLGELKLSTMDTVAYMAPPAALFLLPFCLIPKPVPGQWFDVFGQKQMSDLQILINVWSVNKTTVAWLTLSGAFSFVYNLIQFNIVHTLSPSMTAFGGNFNKAALIFMTLLFPFLQVAPNPKMPYIAVIWGAVICNIIAFSTYSYLQFLAKAEAKEKVAQAKALTNDDEAKE